MVSFKELEGWQDGSEGESAWYVNLLALVQAPEPT